MNYKIKFTCLVLSSFIHLHAALRLGPALENEYAQKKHDLRIQNTAPIIIEATVINIKYHDSYEENHAKYHNNDIVGDEPAYEEILDVSIRVDNVYKNTSLLELSKDNIINFKYSITRFSPLWVGPSTYNELEVKLHEKLRFHLKTNAQSLYSLNGGTSSIERLDNTLAKEFQLLEKEYTLHMLGKINKQLSLLPREDYPHFKFDNFTLDRKAKEKIRKIFQDYEKYFLSDAIIKIVGNTDRLGSDAYNYFLGLKRAISVKKHLIELGVINSNITIVSYGEANPLCIENTQECSESNRLVEFNFLY